MNGLSMKKKVRRIYILHRTALIRVLRFVLGLVLFLLINTSMGYMKPAASWFCTGGLSLVCIFFPCSVMMLLVAALVLVHCYGLSLAAVAGVGSLFLLLYIFYLRLSPKMAWLVLLTAACSGLQIPAPVIVAAGLLLTPAALPALVCGVFACYVVRGVSQLGETLQIAGTSEMMTAVSAYMGQFFGSGELWVTLLAVIVGFFLVYLIRTRGIDQGWEVATLCGSVAIFVILFAGETALSLALSRISILVGTVLAVGVGVLLAAVKVPLRAREAEWVEFEDDTYHYYVKAVPKDVLSDLEEEPNPMGEMMEEKPDIAAQKAMEKATGAVAMEATTQVPTRDIQAKTQEKGK